jgi:hypothetical protein
MSIIFLTIRSVREQIKNVEQSRGKTFSEIDPELAAEWKVIEDTDGSLSIMALSDFCNRFDARYELKERKGGIE